MFSVDILVFDAGINASWTPLVFSVVMPTNYVSHPFKALTWNYLSIRFMIDGSIMCLGRQLTPF
jgi:hypothetical protein